MIKESFNPFTAFYKVKKYEKICNRVSTGQTTAMGIICIAGGSTFVKIGGILNSFFISFKGSSKEVIISSLNPTAVPSNKSIYSSSSSFLTTFPKILNSP
ncbi:hypothetical protein MTBMA_c14660 [Methanothermobacter marburgensis str. Marburg]|uniref:Uncharacterized protein n=1 Tax=Methanothermobacter marburgensis (strain ATCC BAA-927 / DSM 2133 / JCM 14651 / NBRC 100331 / OCM 82 / Marburg) TaxID=79929 RepID=D9PXU7_METTM|nr:hypothetical protein MTBMA_c14660 [Methanothermobacter marburgensis str. Marburg]